MKRFASLALFLISSMVATGALAGIAETPLPVLEAGKATLHLYSVPGVFRNGGLETAFSCTSTDSVPMQVCVEVFAAIGIKVSNDCSFNQLSVAPGATATFTTSYVASVFAGSGALFADSSPGSARILATSSKLACTAFLVDSLNTPPTSMVYLTIIKKTKQKGQ